MPNTFGHLYRCATFGESHGGAVGVVIDGCPPGHTIDLDQVQAWLDRRRPGQSHLASPRGETDQVEIVSGLEQGVTLGTPICMMVRNKDAKPGHYSDLKQVFRPSHADYTTWVKYGLRPASGGGRASARETIGRVAAAAIAEQVLTQAWPQFSAVAYVDQVHGVQATVTDPQGLKRAELDQHALRAPDCPERDAMEQEIITAKKRGDTVGGTIRGHLMGVPAGIGEPVFDKLEAELARAMMSLPASKGFEIGSGFAATLLYGSEHNDEFINDQGRIRTRTNRSGGVQGGISNGESIDFRIGFKPVSTIFKDQQSVTNDGEEVTMKPKQGRHDPCVLPRAVPMVEAMAILVAMDHWLRQLAIRYGRGPAADEA